jgi:hypothetical protein
MLLDEMFRHQYDNVLPALPQRGQAERKHAQAVIQIHAKRSGLKNFFETRVGNSRGTDRFSIEAVFGELGVVQLSRNQVEPRP